MLKRLFLLSVLGVIAFSHSAQAAVICNGFTPEVEVVPSFGHIQKDRSLRAVDLHSEDAWGRLMVNHIDGKADLKSDLQFRIQKAAKSNEICVILSKVKILYRLDPTLQMIDDYPKDSCEHKQIIAHEEVHIAVAKDFLSQTTPMLKDYVLKSMDGRAGKASYLHLQDQDKVSFEESINDILSNYARYLNQEHREAQKRVVDGPATREKIYAACPDWHSPEYYMNPR